MSRSTIGLVLVSIILVLLLSFLLANVIYSHQPPRPETIEYQYFGPRWPPCRD